MSPRTIKPLDLTRLSATKLRAETEKRETAHGLQLAAIIAAGFGDARMSDLWEWSRESALLPRTQLAKAYCQTREAEQACYDELHARRRWHGSDKPIKRRD